MDYFLLIGLITLAVLIVSFTIYSALTNSIIKDQEREIEELRHKNAKLEINNDYLQKSRDNYKAYFDSHNKIISEAFKPFEVSCTVLDDGSREVLKDLFEDF